MASYTTNLNLKKPAGSENVAIGDINNNMDTIDQAFGTLNSNLQSIQYAGTTATDCNECKTYGLYWTDENTANSPGSYYIVFVLTHYRSSSFEGTQLAIGVNGTMKIRAWRNASEFSAWKTVSAS